MRKALKSYFILVVLFGAITVTSLVAAQSPCGAERQVTAPASTAEEIYWHIRYLASDELKGRFTGSPEAQKAAEYIAADFRTYGLKPVGDDQSYFQHFPFIAGVNLGEKNSLATTINGQTRHWRVKEDFAPMAFSTQEPVEAGVAFVGYGISASDIGYDDYAGLDVNGRVVLALRFSPEGDNPHSQFERYASLRAKALMARQHGAKAIAFIADTDDFKSNKLSQLEFDYSFSDSGIVAIGLSRQLANELVVTTGTSLDEWQKKINSGRVGERENGRVGEWENSSLPHSPIRPFAHSSHSPIRPFPHSFLLPGVTAKIQVDLIKDIKPAANVVGYLQGSDPTLKDEVIVIGAHYDHLGLGGPNSLAPKQLGEVHHGADDNASGTAGVLELAQAFAAHRNELKRSLLFMAFSGEEEGLLGSSYYVKHPIFPIERTVAMINMDMIGRLKDNKLIVQGLGTSPQWPSLIEELNTASPARPFGLKFDLKTSADGVGPSDHSSFYLKDIPVLFFFTGVHSDYHKPSDDYDKINAEGEARIVKFVYDAVSKIQALPARPQFTRTQSTEQPGRMGFRVTLGVMPDYAEEVEGLKISGTREGGPAEKAGLKAGDIIVRVGTTKIKNIYDYTFVLGELKAGEEVGVEVMRDKQRLVLKVVPEKRN